MSSNEVIIVGGGLAGLCAAIHLSKIGIGVKLIEKNSYPKHKVCGEYISNEVLPYLKWLDLDINAIQPTILTKLEFSTVNGKKIKQQLPLGGFGISRYTLDEFLYKKAIQNGCEVFQNAVIDIVYLNNNFTVTLADNNVLNAKIVVGAFGKRSVIDQKLNRSFLQKKAHWLAVKAHYYGNFPNDIVGLYNFNGGYCGVSKVEDDKINICYLADYKTFQKYKNTDDYQKNIVFENPNLKYIFENATPIFKKPLTISQISFEKKRAVENHILMIGDTAGLIHPLCGNGMAMAIHSAKIASELIQKFFNNSITSRAILETEYQNQWNINFKKRVQTGRMLAKLFQKPKIAGWLLQIIMLYPKLLPIIIKKTHGKPIQML